MNKDSAIYVAGHRGLVGSALIHVLKQQGYHNLITRTHAECDLTCQQSVRELFAAEKPEYVFLAAAKVGGILANNTYPADFIQQNLQIQTNIISEAHRQGVKRLLFLGSSCIYPRDCPQPIKEEYLLTGPLEATNRPYALAKIAGIEMCWAFNRQFGTQYLAVMPTNLYGPGDNYDLNHSHVIPALIRKMHEATLNDADSVTIWGSGTPKREFLYSLDLAEACVYLLQLDDPTFADLLTTDTAPLVNIGCGEDLTIADLASTIAKIVGFNGTLVFDTSKPDGTPRKVLSVQKMTSLGWKANTLLEKGLQAAYAEFLKTISNVQLAKEPI